MKVIEFILWFTFFYPIVMTLMWIFGSILYKVRQRRERKAYKDTCSRRNFTIIIPVFNEEEKIERLLKQNLRNMYPNLKFWVINDCSTDKTKEILDTIEDPRLKITNLEKNIGKAAVLNYAIERVEDEYFICVDSDTYIYPDAFFVLNRRICNETDDSICAYAGSLTIDQENMDNTLLKIQKLEYRSIISMIKRGQDYFTKNLLTVSGAFVCYKTAVVREVGGFDETNATEDIEITWRMTTKGYRAKFLDDFLAEVFSPSTGNSLIKQRIRWNLGGLQTSKKYFKLLFKRGFWAHKIFLLERYFSVVWLYGFLFTSLFLVSKVVFGYPSKLPLGKLLLPSLIILLAGILLQMVAYKFDKGNKESRDEFISLILYYPFAYWLIQPLGYFGSLIKYHSPKKNHGKWRNEESDRANIRRVGSAIFDISVFLLLYHFVRVILKETVPYLPQSTGMLYYLIILFWVIVTIIWARYFLSVKKSTLGQGMMGISATRIRSGVFNFTSPVVFLLLVNMLLNMRYSVAFLEIDDYNVLVNAIDRRLTAGGILAPVLYIPLLLVLIEGYFDILGRFWGNRLIAK